MACTTCRSPMLRFISRKYSAKTSPNTQKSKGAGGKVCILPNKVVVASAPSNLPVSRVSICFKVGSRNECYESLGATHMLRIATGLTTNKSSAFAITRNIQQIGGSLSVTSDRETIAYTLEVTDNVLEKGLNFLEDVATIPAFKPWELSDNLPRLKQDIASVPNNVKSVEFLHKAAFHTGLGNSVFCPEHQISNLSSETLQQFFSSNFTADRCAVAGVGVDHEMLVGLAQNLNLNTNESKDSSSKYHGGSEIRLDRSGNLAHVAIGGEGGKLSNMREAISFAVLQYAYGVGPCLKYGNANGLLGKAVACAISNNFELNTLNASYTDNGLFGFVLSADGKDIRKGIENAVKIIRSGNLPTEEITRAKAQLKAAVLFNTEADTGLLSLMTSQASLLRDVSDVESILNEIDAVSATDIQAAARKTGASKLTIGAVGNLSNVPYISEL